MTAIDPADYTVDEVKAWVTGNWHDHRNDPSIVSVHDSERDGKARVSLLDWLDHFAEDHAIDLTPNAGEPDPTGVAITLSPSSAQFGSAPFTLTVTGAGFTDQSGIAFAGGSKVTTFVSDTEVSTVVDWSVITGPGVVQVWVVTDGVSTDAADFTVTPAVEPPPVTQPMTPDAVLTPQLRAWGISGEPLAWAPTRWQPVIAAIRFANTGFGTQATVQGLLDSTFPFNRLQASAICLSSSYSEPTVGVTKADGRIRLKIAASELPPENVTWLIDSIVVGHGDDLELEGLSNGEHLIEVQVAVAGNVYAARQVVDDASV